MVYHECQLHVRLDYSDQCSLGKVVIFAPPKVELWSFKHLKLFGHLINGGNLSFFIFTIFPSRMYTSPRNSIGGNKAAKVHLSAAVRQCTIRISLNIGSKKGLCPRCNVVLNLILIFDILVTLNFIGSHWFRTWNMVSGFSLHYLPNNFKWLLILAACKLTIGLGSLALEVTQFCTIGSYVSVESKWYVSSDPPVTRKI